MQMAPRTVAPERINFSALRELANLSAHAAISRHTRRTLVRTMYSKLLVALVAFLSAAALLWMWDAANAGNHVFYASLAAILTAIFWGVEYAILTGRLMVSKSGNIDWIPPSQRKPVLKANEAAEPEEPLESQKPRAAWMSSKSRRW